MVSTAFSSISVHSSFCLRATSVGVLPLGAATSSSLVRRPDAGHVRLMAGRRPPGDRLTAACTHRRRRDTPHEHRMTALHSEVSVSGRNPERASVRDVVGAYVGLTKPRVIELLLLTTVPVMFFAEGGVPPLELVVWTVLGGTLSAGSANALNCVYDRDIDEQMRRTRRRALPRHIVTPRAAFVFGIT